MKFPVIVTDNPWHFETHSEKGQGRSPEYPKMTVSRMKGMPIADVADKNCRLFMWTSGPYLEQCLAIGKAWGFQYSTWAFVWAKCRKKTVGRMIEDITSDVNWEVGNGYVTRANAEIVLCFKKGSVKRLDAGVRGLVVEPLQPLHSQKPERIQDGIERLYAGPYLEVFARRERKGWVTIGNEITGNDIYVDLERLAQG